MNPSKAEIAVRLSREEAEALEQSSRVPLAQSVKNLDAWDSGRLKLRTALVLRGDPSKDVEQRLKAEVERHGDDPKDLAANPQEEE